jgi:hypothetical protein
LGQWLVDESAPLADSAGGLARGSAFCIGIAVVGIVTALWIRRVPPARPDLRFRMSALTMTPETRAVLRNDLPLLAAILASCTFWLVSGIAIQSINSLGLVQLELGKQWTSLLTAMIGVGIAVGAVTAGRMCRGRADPRVVRLGVWGIVAFLLILSISLPGGQHLLGFWGSLVVLMLVGISAGLFAIPVQVYIQARPPAGQKGRMIAVMNQANFIAITLSGVIYLAMDRWAVSMEWPRSTLFAMIAGLFLPVVLFYRLPGDE